MFARFFSPLVTELHQRQSIGEPLFYERIVHIPSPRPQGHCAFLLLEDSHQLSHTPSPFAELSDFCLFLPLPSSSIRYGTKKGKQGTLISVEDLFVCAISFLLLDPLERSSIRFSSSVCMTEAVPKLVLASVSLCSGSPRFGQCLRMIIPRSDFFSQRNSTFLISPLFLFRLSLYETGTFAWKKPALSSTSTPALREDLFQGCTPLPLTYDIDLRSLSLPPH